MSQIFKNTEWSDFLWGDFQRFTDKARAAVREGASKIAERFDDFANEGFYRFYSKDPQRNPNPTPGSEWAEKLHKAAEDVPEFQNLKEACQGSDWKSGIANTALLEELTKKVTPPEKPFEDLSGNLAAQECLKKLLEDEEVQDEEREKIEGMLQGLVAEADAKAEAAKDVAAMLDTTEIRNALRATAQGASSAIQDVENAMDGLGCGGGAHNGSRGNQGAVKDIMPLVRDNDHIKEIMKLAGRLKRLAKQKQKAKPKLGTNEFTGVLSGDDLSRMLPVEGMLLMDPEMEVVFGRRMQEKALLQYELKEKPEEQQGPIVMLLDSSGSMAGIRQQWAAAVALAFLSIAQDQKRDFALVYFGSAVLKVSEFDVKKVLDPKEMLDAVTFFASDGDTNFEKPLHKAIYLINSRKNFEKADIIMVTDGCAPISKQFLDAWDKDKLAAGFSCYSILIGSKVSQDTLNLFSDEVVVLSDVLKDEAKMHDLFGRV